MGKGEIARCNFSFSHGVFKRFVMQTRKNQGLFGKELKSLKFDSCRLTSENLKRDLDFPRSSFSSFFLPFPKRQSLDSSKLRKFADDNFPFDENGKNVLQKGRNAVGKGEIAHYELFLLFPQCFKKTCNADR